MDTTNQIANDVYQPLEIDCSMTYCLDHDLFVGDMRQPALLLPWQLNTLDTPDSSSSPWKQQLTWEQAEIVDIIGKFINVKYV